MQRRQLFTFLGSLTSTTLASPAPAGPAPRQIQLQISPVRGYHYRQSTTLLSDLPPGTPIQLRPEPTNPHDPHAVAIYWADQHIGYLPRENNKIAAHLLAQGLPLMAQVHTHHPDPEHWEPLTVEVSFQV
jgi:hypothetical protein